MVAAEREDGGFTLEPRDALELSQGTPSSEPGGNSRAELAVAPYPVYNPVIGGGLAAAAVMVLPSNGKSGPPTTIGAGGFASENGSWAVGGGVRASLANDQWRVMLGGGFGHLNYDFYGVGDDAGDEGNSVALTQEAILAGGSALRRCTEGLYLGPVAMARRITTQPDSGSGADALESEQGALALGLSCEYDTRDSTFYPRTGWYTQTKILQYLASTIELLDADRPTDPYTTFTLRVNAYYRVGEAGVIACRLANEWVDDAAPFYDLPMFGAHSDLRGYEAGRYRDRTLIAGQAEYRHELGFWRLGAAAFAGIGAVAPSYAALGNAETLPAGGLGLRWTAAPENHINLRVDFAWSRDGEAWYVSVGEAF